MTAQAQAAPEPPATLGAPGRELWADITGRWVLTPAELAVLAQAARIVDVIAALDDKISAAPIIASDGRPVPAVAESRLQRIAFGRLIAQLKLPDEQAKAATGRKYGYWSTRAPRPA